MLNSINLSDKTYEELLAEAIAQIPLYSREWTNFNASDPGITMLQNLTAFQLLQQEEINTIPEEIWRKLLKLVGYQAKENHPALIYAQAPLDGGPYMPEGSRLWSGEIPYETTGPVALQPWGLDAIYAEYADDIHEITKLLSTETDSIAYPFGSTPSKDNALVCVLSGIPEMGEPLHLWVQVAEEELRTPFGEDQKIPLFSQIKWQYYTENGWHDARFKDETAGFLRSGLVTLWLKDEIPSENDLYPASGCAFRCVLCSAEYDRIPRLQSISVHLFSLSQQYTHIRCITCEGGETVQLEQPLMEHHMVFCREEPDGPYFFYYEDPGMGFKGRYYQEEHSELETLLHFRSGFTPCQSPDAVRVICYDDEMIHHRDLGTVYGYDKQIIPMEQVQNVIQETILVAIQFEKAEKEYFVFVAPGEKGPDGFSYHVRSQSAEIVVDDPGRGGYRLLLCGCASTMGARGNLRRGAKLNELGGYDGREVLNSYSCPAPGRGGASYESTEDLRLRFSQGMQDTSVAVQAEDYERLVHQTPGLCIHKVHAIPDQQKNLVKIAVKPYTEDSLPKLSKAYLNQIYSYLEPRRMLTTRIQICQPRYLPIGVNATISIRGLYSYAKEETERVLREALDYVNGSQNFGEWVRFYKIYQMLSNRPFVDGVDALTIYPEGWDAVIDGSDIRLEDDCLCYPGTINITLREFGR